ncbi:MAG TPA: hypothetical protein VK720_07990 [Terracidiphilus sp.]|nr:hypothetical protein [Terracidiphilus sp.]
MLSPNFDRSVIPGKARGVDNQHATVHPAPDQPQSDATGERSGSRVQLDASFRRVTHVGAYQPSFHRGDRIR